MATDTIPEIIFSLAEFGVHLPFRSHSEDPFTVTDATGETVFAVDHNGERDDEDAIEIAGKLIALANTCTLLLSAPASRDVLAERRRQVEAEGWTLEHDDAHSSGEMARAAAAYTFGVSELGGAVRCGKHSLPWRTKIWPWDRKWWKPSSRRHNLVKAAALLIAEIERIDRAEAADA